MREIICSRKWTMTGLLVLVVIAMVGFCTARTFADTVANMPDSDYFTAGTNPRIEVSQTEAGNSLEAPNSTVKIVSTISNPTLTIYGYTHCADNAGGTDTRGYAETFYNIYSTLSGGNHFDALVNGTTYNDGGGQAAAPCNNNASLSIPLSGSQATKIGSTNYYIYIFDASMAQLPGCGVVNSSCGDGGVNDFSLYTSSGVMSYVGSNDGVTSNDYHFALQNRQSPGTNVSIFQIPLADQCGVASGNQTLQWFDDDQFPGGGQSGIQSVNMTFKILDVTTGKYVGPAVASTNDVLPNSASGVGGVAGPQFTYDAATETFRPQTGVGQGTNEGKVVIDITKGNSYNWQWFNVQNHNGIQFELPYDSFYSNGGITCTPPPPPKLAPTVGASASCSTLYVTAYDKNYPSTDPVKTVTYKIGTVTGSLAIRSGLDAWSANGWSASVSSFDGFDAQDISVTATDSAGSTVFTGSPANSLKVPSGCATPSCTSTLTLNAPGEIDGVPEPNSTITGSASILFSPYGTNGLPALPTTPPGAAISVSLVNLGTGVSYPFAALGSPTGSEPAAGEYEESQGFSGSVPSYGEYYATWSGYGSPSCNNKATQTPLSVDWKPYLKVYGGDTMAGSAFASANSADSCSSSLAVPNAAAGSYAWDVNNTTGSFNGSSTSAGVFAVDLVDGFASANTVQAQGSITKQPESITFANNGTENPLATTAADGPYYGGDFGTSNCVPDYYNSNNWNSAYVTTLTAPTTVTAFPTGTAADPGGPLDRNVYLSNGFNVVIDPTGGSFDYPGAPWASIDDIPLFYVVVKGANIYIDSSASKIAGVYIAEPSSSGVGGNIYTCSDGDTIYAPSQLFTTGSGSTGGCAQQLTVDGALIGNNIRFWRTNSSNSGSANAAPADTNTTNCTLATNNASETVCYNPLNWLANPFSPGSDDYNEITGLPPTL